MYMGHKSMQDPVCGHNSENFLSYFSFLFSNEATFKKSKNKEKQKNNSCSWWRRNGFHSNLLLPWPNVGRLLCKNLQQRQILSLDTVLLIHMLAFPNYAASTMPSWHKQFWHSNILLPTLVIDGQGKTGLWYSPLSF